MRIYGWHECAPAVRAVEATQTALFASPLVKKVMQVDPWIGMEFETFGRGDSRRLLARRRGSIGRAFAKWVPAGAGDERDGKRPNVYSHDEPPSH